MDSGAAHASTSPMFGFSPAVTPVTRWCTKRSASCCATRSASARRGRQHWPPGARTTARVAVRPGPPRSPPTPPDPRNAAGRSAPQWCTYFNNPPGVSGSGGWVNSRRLAAPARCPARTGTRTRAASRASFAAFAADGSIRRRRVLGSETIAATTIEHSCGDDLIPKRPSRWDRLSAHAGPSVPSDAHVLPLRLGRRVSASPIRTPGSRSAT